MRAGVVLMTYGSPRDLDDVGAYITRVRGGREPSTDLLTEFRRRYAVIGMSPLIDITRQQAAALEEDLKTSDDFLVGAGMRFSDPSIAETAGDLVKRGAERLLGVILSPQYSPTLMGGYDRAVQDAANGLPARTVEAWHLNPAFVDVLASRVRAALAKYPDEKRERVPVLLTAHILPRRVVDREPESRGAVAGDGTRGGHGGRSASGSLVFRLPERRAYTRGMAEAGPARGVADAGRGREPLVVAPVQFLADHLETLYDVDVAGR